MATTPSFASTAKSWQAWTVPTAGGVTQTTTYTTAGLQATGSARSGANATPPTGAVLLMSAASAGSRIDEITFTSLGTSTANVGRIFINNGTNVYLYKEITIPAVTPSVSQVAASVTTNFNNFVLATGSSVYVAIATLDSAYSVVAFGGDF